MSMYVDHEHIPFVIEALEATWKYLNGEYSSLPAEQPAEQEDASAEA